MSKSLTVAALTLCCLLAALPAHGAAEEGAAGRDALLAVGDPAPDWLLEDSEGRTHSLAEYRGRVVVLDFWATWCGPCARVMPRLEKLHRKYGGRGVAVFGVNSWETGDPAAVMSRKGYTYKLLLKGEGMAPAYGVTSLPVVYVVGVDGRVVYAHAGPEHKNLAEVIEKHLAARGVSPTASARPTGR